MEEDVKISAVFCFFRGVSLWAKPFHTLLCQSVQRGRHWQQSGHLFKAFLFIRLHIIAAVTFFIILLTLTQRIPFQGPKYGVWASSGASWQGPWWIYVFIKTVIKVQGQQNTESVTQRNTERQCTSTFPCNRRLWKVYLEGKGVRYVKNAGLNVPLHSSVCVCVCVCAQVCICL